MPKIRYPYIPKGKKFLYISANNKFIKAAKEMAKKSGCAKQATGAVVVKNRIIIGRGANAGKLIKSCPKDKQGYGTGEGYHLCKKICLTQGHSEVASIRNAQDNGYDTQGADFYLYGHWWCCENCWNIMIRAGIKNVYLLEKSWELFNPEINVEIKN